MTIRELMNRNLFEVRCEGAEPDREISCVFCCDLLSIAMSRGIENAAWVTVMGNLNTVAVMKLTEMSLIVLAEGVSMDAAGLQKAQEEGCTVLATDLPVFDAALLIHRALHGEI